MTGLAAALSISGAARAEPVRVTVDVMGVEDDASRAVSVRLFSELAAAGFSLVTDAADVKVNAYLVRRADRWALFIELPEGGSLVVRADDVPTSEQPAVLALRAVERLRAALSAPAARASSGAASPAPAPAEPQTAPVTPTIRTAPPPPRLVSLTPPSARPPIVAPPDRAGRPRSPFDGVFLAGGGFVSIDAGGVSLAPAVSVGLGIGAGFFLRASGWGPSTETTVTAPEGLARTSIFGGRLDAGVARSVREGTSLGVLLGLGGAGYAVAGEASPGFVARTGATGTFVAGVSGLVAQHVAGPLHLVLELGVQLSIPAVNVRIVGNVVSERGFPELHAAPGVLLAF